MNAARGTDFEDVDNVVRFDAPVSVHSDVRRVGRCARGGRPGNALTLIASDPTDTNVWAQACCSIRVYAHPRR